MEQSQKCVKNTVLVKQERGDPYDFKSKFACILEASESTRMRMEESLPKYHEGHIAEKVDNSLQHYNMAQIYSYASSNEDTHSKSSSGWERLEKIPAWDLTKVRSKKEVMDEARTKGAKVHFASLMDIYHLKNAELETKHGQKYKGRVVLRGDIEKDDSGSYAVFTEEGSSASQMTGAKVMDIFTRLPGCEGQAADGVSVYTQVKMEDAHKFFKIPKSECPDIWIRLPRQISRSWTILLCSSVIKRKRKSIFMPRTHDASRSRRNSHQRVDPKHVRFGPVSDIKVCIHYGRYSIEVQVRSLFQDQTVSWNRIVDGIDKFVREAMPIQEEEGASVKPAAKARPILKPSSTSNVNFTPIEQRQWIDIEIQESKGSLLFSSVKIHHSITSTKSKCLSRRRWRSPL